MSSPAAGSGSRPGTGRRRLWFVLPLVALGWIVASVLGQPRYPRGSPRRPVEIVRDDLDVPHIRAAGRFDLFFAQGYVTAADRMFQMDWTRRRLLGQRSAVVGRSAIVEDFRLKALSLERVARDLYASLSPEDRAAVDAYAAGVNEWLRTHSLPLEFRRLDYRPRPWRGIDCLVVWRGMALTLTDLTDDLADAGALDAGAGGARAWLSPGPVDSEERLGSNAWAVSATRSGSGYPLLAGDPHLAYSLPGALCRVALADSVVAATGYSIPGVPGVVIGRNRDVAWTVTAFEGDGADVFTFPMDANDPGRYQTAGGWLSVQRRRPVVWLRLWGPVVAPVFWQALETADGGPVIGRQAGRLLALKWAGSEALPGEGLVTVHTIEARSCFEMERILARLGLPDVNVVCADQAGNIAHYVAGRIPLRSPHRGPRDGLDTTLAWGGFVPFESLPREVNPAGGFVASCNGPPPQGGPYLGHDWPEARQRRMEFLLSDGRVLGVEDFAAFQADRLVPGAIQDVADRLSRLDRDGLSAEAQAAAALLARWDGRAEIDSVAPTLYRTWQAFGNNGQSLEEACTWLARRLGPDPSGWTWGTVHQAVLRHPLGAVDSLLSVGPFPRAGDRGTLDVGGYAKFDTTSWPPALSLHGPAARFIADLSPQGSSSGVLLAGQSGNPESPHYADQLEFWETGRRVPFAGPGEMPATGRKEWLRSAMSGRRR